MLRDCPIDHRCMKRIDVDSVLTSVTAHLAGGTSTGRGRPSPQT
jgi:hypothetical protein